MEIKKVLASQQVLMRRYGAWALSMGLFGAGSWSVYDISTAQPDNAAAASTASATPGSTLSHNEQIEQLFASSNEASTTPAAPTVRAKADRYAMSATEEAAPALPPLAESSDRYRQQQVAPRDAAAVTAVSTPMPPNPFADTAPAPATEVASNTPNEASDQDSTPEASAAQLAGEEDADSQVAEQDVSAMAAEGRYAAVEPTAESAEAPRVMRGQEPDAGNPLRQSNTVEQAGAEEARAAFQAGESLPPAKPLQVAATPREVEADLPPAQPLPARGSHDAPIAVGGQPTPVEAPTPEFTASADSRPSTPAAPPYAMPPRESNYENSPRESYGAAVGSSSPIPNPVADAPEEKYAPESDAYGQSPARQESSILENRSSPSDRSAVTPTPGITNAPGTGRPGESVLEGMQSPSIAIQKLAPPEIQVGKKCTFAVRIKNIGQRAAQNVVIHDVVPLGTQLVGTAPRATVSGAQVKWDLGTLSVGEERIVELELMPTDEGELGSVASVTFGAEASVRTRSTRPELALRLTSVKPRVMAGEKQLVQIEISNPGSGDATGVMLLETLPEGVSHEAGTALEFPVGTLRAGETRKLDLVLNAERAGVISNVMTVRGDANLEVTASCDFEIIAPELQLTVDGPKRKYLERPAKFVVNVDNPGTASAKDVQLVTQLPKGLQFVSANNKGEYDSTTHSVYWSLAELPANERGSVEVTALPVEPGDHTIKTATRAQQGLEARTENNLAVEGLAALKFQVVDQVDPVEIGGETSYVIRVENQGSKSAANVQVVATLPEGMRAINARGDTRHEIQGNRVVFTPLPQLAPKSESTFHVMVQGIRPGDQRIRVELTTDEIQQPIMKEESTRVYADQ